MARKWGTIQFVQAFFESKLGRKRVHGSYRTLEGDYCKLLVRATTHYGTPAGNDLIAIDLSDNNNRLVFWKETYSRHFSYRISRNVQEAIGMYQMLPSGILTGSEDNILNSGIVDITPTHALIEIGDKPFLLHREVRDSGAQTVILAHNPGSSNPSYGYANQVPKRVASIAEAQEAVKDPVDSRQICKEWWSKEMPPDFVPPEFDPELVKVLSTALNPIDFGFEIDECSVGMVSGSGYGAATIRSFIPKKKLLEARPQTTRIQKWKQATINWSAAADSLLKRKPVEYKGLSIHSSRYMTASNDEERIGTIIVTTEGVYLTGEVHSKADWNQSDTLTKWYKLTQHANQINIPKCI